MNPLWQVAGGTAVKGCGVTQSHASHAWAWTRSGWVYQEWCPGIQRGTAA